MGICFIGFYKIVIKMQKLPILQQKKNTHFVLKTTKIYNVK